MSRSVGVVVPAYRPAVSVLTQYLEELDTALNPETIRVELDTPTSATLDALSETSATINTVDHRRGKGAAITAGFEALETDVLVFVDADGSTPVESVTDVVDAVRSGSGDLAVGSRRHPEATVRSHQTVLRQHLGDVFAWLARRLLDVQLRDYQCGAKAMTRETWLAIREQLYEPGFAWDVEVVSMAGALGFDIEEVPVIWVDHPDSTVTTSNAVPELLRALIRARRRSRDIAGQTTETDRPERQDTRYDSGTIPLVERVE